MSRVLWLTRRVTGHDRRFTSLLADAGHQVHYLALDSWEQDSPPALAPGVHWVDWGERPTGDVSTPEQARALLPPLRRVLDRVAPHLIHAGPVPTGGLLAALADAHPLIVMSWGSDLLVDAAQGAEWAEATRTALSAADLFVCDSATVLRSAREFAALPDDRVVRFPWGTDIQKFSPGVGVSPLRRELFGGQSEDRFVVLCTRSWEPIYGIDTLLDGFAAAYKEDRRLRLVLLGGGSLKREVGDRIAESGLDSAVHTPGAVPHGDLPEWFRAADLYASCAHSDGSSVSLLEAMASGLPALVTEIPSNREWVEPGENGWLAGLGDSRQVSEALLEAAASPEAVLEAVGRRNRQIAELRADWSRESRRLVEAYRALLLPVAGEKLPI